MSRNTQVPFSQYCFKILSHNLDETGFYVYIQLVTCEKSVSFFLMLFERVKVRTSLFLCPYVDLLHIGFAGTLLQF